MESNGSVLLKSSYINTVYEVVQYHSKAESNKLKMYIINPNVGGKVKSQNIFNQLNRMYKEK